MFWVRDRHGQKRVFHDADSYRLALALGGPGSSMGGTWHGPDGEDEDEVFSEDPPSKWNTAVETIRERRSWIYLHGDCWHMALAMRRLWGLPLCAVMNRHAGTDPDMRSMSHVGARMPSGGFLDVRGHLPTEEAFCERAGNPVACSVQDVTAAAVKAELDHYAEGVACDWEDGESYPFCAETEEVARILFSGLLGPAMTDEDEFTEGDEAVAEIVRSLEGPLMEPGEAAVETATAFIMEKWLERHDRMAEDHERAFGTRWDRPRPGDLSGACKFSSLFIAACFGGVIRGNEDHQFAVVAGGIVDPNSEAKDVVGKPGAYRHDPAFFGNPDHIESLMSCVPRVREWMREFQAEHVPQVSPTK